MIGSRRPWTRRGYLDEILPELWPAPSRIVSGSGAGTDYVLLPSSRRPKVMVPRRPRRATAAVLRNYKSSATAAQQARLTAMSVAARFGVTDLMPGRLSIDTRDAGPSGSIVAYLSEALGRDVHVGLYIGAPGRANLKPVLQLLSADGHTFAFAKLGMTPLTCELVAGEGRTLTWLGQQQLSRVRVPEVLHRGRWHGYEVLVQTALPRVGRVRIAAPVLSAAMAEVAALAGTRAAPATRSSYWARTAERLAALPESGSAAALLQQWELLGAADSVLLTFGSWHGDWTAWNMTLSGDRALLWDWERYGPDVPVGFDALHHHLQSAIVRGGVPADRAALQLLDRAPGLLEPLGVPAGAAPVVVALYLVEIGSRYLADGQAEAGAALGDLHSWLLPALRAQVQRLR